MSEAIESNMNEMMAGDGSGLALPPAFVFVNTKSHRKYKKNNDKVDGRTKGAKTMLSRINKRKMKKNPKKSNQIKSFLDVLAQLEKLILLIK